MELETKKKKIKFHILAIFVIIIFSAAICPITLQNDTFYTVKIGEHILQNGIDGHDPFSWHQGLSYTYPHWLYDVIMFLIYQVSGWTGIYLSTIVLACLLGITLYGTNTKLTKNPLTSFVLTIGVMYLTKSFITARAQLPTFILFVLTIYCIESFLQTKKKRYGVGLVVIPLLIANLHVAVWPFYFVLFLPYIAEYLLCLLMDWNLLSNSKIAFYKLKLWIGQKRKKKFSSVKQEQISNKIERIKDNKKIAIEKRKENRKHPYKLIIRRNENIKYLILIMIVAAFTGLCTPLGDTPYTYLIKTMDGNTTQNINEHLPITLIKQRDVMCIMAAFIAIIMLTDRRIRLSDFFLLVGLVLLTFISKRQASMFFLLGMLILNRLICSFLEKYDQGLTEKVTDFMITVCGRIITICLVCILSIFMIRPKIVLKQTYVNKATYPVEASEYILQNLDVSKIKLYNEYNYGSYLLYKGIPVFIDSRADLYDPEFNQGTNVFNDFINISNVNLHYEDKFEDYGITHVLVYKSAKINLFISKDSNYKEIYSDNSFVLYERLEK